MAREHHCPNCGAQACNASTSKIHTCGVCAAIWEEDLSAPVAAPAAPKPPSPAPAAAAAVAPKPAATTASPPAAPPTGAKPASPPPSPPAAAPPKPAAPAAPTGVAPAKPAVTPAAPAAPPAGKAPTPAVSGTVQTLAEVIQGAKVKRCPACQSDGVAQPSDFATAQGRLVLVDSQTYRAHRWYADTGELLPAVAPPAPPAAAAAATPAARPQPAT